VGRAVAEVSGGVTWPVLCSVGLLDNDADTSKAYTLQGASNR